MTQIDKALATLACIVLMVCMSNVGTEFIKLNQLKESAKAALLIRQIQTQTRYNLSK